MTGSAPARLRVHTREIDPIDDLVEYTDPNAPLVWLRRGDGMVARGTVLRLDVGAASTEPRTVALARAWAELAADAEINDEVRLPGTGLVGFGALTFDERSAADSSIIVPALIVGRRGGRSWVTSIRLHDDEGEDAAAAPIPYGPYWSATLGPGALDPDGYQAAVEAGLQAIADGEVGKVVLARDIVGTVPEGSDLRRLPRELSTGYLDTWVFAVDGIIGASPETLVTSHGRNLTARVLAGTFARGADADEDVAARATLAASAKNLDEHSYAVHSVVEALGPHTTTLSADAEPFTLELPNVWHLATDVEGVLSNGSSSLDLVSALHPTAAVAGTPTDAAIEAIRRIEPFDRRRYAGPVGWIDAAGDGEWAIALRCAQFEPEAVGGLIPVAAHAGAGIVAGSEPEAELLETRVKFRPIVDALA
ncbi:isochorismate synthase [Microbacterium protaetiae]|uniref:isochorismate synthase n=1 Tax=Microbacterium protaetiae TaxID=2509458 RepID=A0A4P6EJZ7_9MICO|nr:isochorismate synthase [Microbacterium protaetiae]QAY60447.1 isochorismate synthase [Microbacterium protaetiae]